LNLLAVKAMAEVDISGQESKNIDAQDRLHFDIAITVCDHLQ